jgi:large subunit ribosomal protein L9
MKVFIVKKCNIGKLGDIKIVSDGYAKNFLIPNGLALEYSKMNEKEILFKTELKEEKVEKEKKKTSALSLKIEEEVLLFKVKAHDDGKLYGSIAEEEIVKGLSEKGISIKKSQVAFSKEDGSKGFKKIGTYYVTINLSSTLNAKLKVKITAEK